MSGISGMILHKVYPYIWLHNLAQIFNNDIWAFYFNNLKETK